MAEVDDGQFNTLAERIAALNQQKNFSSSGDGPRTTGKRAPPPPPPIRPKTTTDPTEAPAPPSRTTTLSITGSNNESPALPARSPANGGILAPPERSPRSDNPAASPPARRLPPPLPGRTASDTPTLPPRRPSFQPPGERRDSCASDVSRVSSISNLSLNNSGGSSATETSSCRRLPPTLDQAKLPPLLPSRREKEREAQAAGESRQQPPPPAPLPMRSAKSMPVVPQTPMLKPSLPPRLPSRSPKSAERPQQKEASPSLPPRRLPPAGTGIMRARTTIENSPLSTNNKSDDAPPPIPLSSRPSLAQINSASSRTSATPNPSSCLICRDFSGPDTVASQHPTSSLPRHDPVSHLARVLCSPFPSATDKARAIFSWCHHNLAYNVDEFFAGRVQSRSVPDTIFHGRAVCQGYAEVYQAIAQRAGLECLVVCGHGKGYGYTPPQDGQAVPPRDPTGHAWNAVRIDNGQWKLVDACWGAGSVSQQRFQKHFTPAMFYLSNDRFGLKHFPADPTRFFRLDGRVPSWDEYVVGPTRGEKAQWFTTATDEGLDEFAFTPAEKHLSLRAIRVQAGASVRFRFSNVCEHWEPERHGKGKNYLLLLKIGGCDGKKEGELRPLDTDGYWWWVDVGADELGRPGQEVCLYGLTTLNGRDARGVGSEEYRRVTRSGGYSMAWEGYAQWLVVE